MRGGSLHNNIIIGRLAERARSLAAVVRTEAAVPPNFAAGFVDLIAERDGLMLVIEAELSPRRVANDIAKARRLRATELWIVAPNRPTADAILAHLNALSIDPIGVRVCVLTLGQALGRLGRCFPLNSVANVLDHQVRIAGASS